MPIRRASHAGSWYTSGGSELSQQLSGWLRRAGPSEQHPRAVICPHAGYSYSGECASYAYSQIDPSQVKRVFILGPSHHYHLNGCAVSQCVKYATPIYDLTIDRAVTEELHNTGRFDVMSQDADEDEHSIEMHLPYVAKVMAEHRDNFTVVPVLVGSISVEKEASYGKIFAKYLADPANLFVISSDFCHWGNRFRYTHYDESKGPIHKSIEHLDREGMDIIERLDHREFSQYLSKYKNTICGRHPIGVFLGAVNELRQNFPGMSLKFRNYAQSNHCKKQSDSSVSYAAATFVMG